MAGRGVCAGRPTFFEAVRSFGDNSQGKVQIYKTCGDFLAGADSQANVSDVVLDLATDWELAAFQLTADVASDEPSLAQYALYLLGNLLSCEAILDSCPQDVQRHLLLEALHCITGEHTAKEPFRMAVWCLSSQKVGFEVIQGLCGQLVAALVDVLCARRWASRCAKHYSATALARLLTIAPNEASALCSHWLPPICSLALEAGGSCDPKQAAILRRQSRICLEQLLVVLPSSYEELASKCVAECLVDHGLLEQMEKLISAVTARGKSAQAPPELAAAVDYVEAWAVFTQLLGPLFLHRAAGPRGGSRLGQRMLKVIQGAFVLQRSAFIPLPAAAFEAWGRLAATFARLGELSPKRIKSPLMLPIVHAVENNVQVEVCQSAIRAWRRLMALLGPRLEDPDVYAAVVVRMCDAIAFSGGEGSGDGIKDEQLSAATRRRQLVLVQETCEALSEALTSAGQKTGPCPLAEASYNTPGSAARHGIEARLLNSPSRCRMLLSTIAKLEAKCCSIGGAAKDGTGEAAKQALQGTWHCIAAAVAAGVNSGGLCNADGAERSSPLEWGEAVKELGSHFLVSACLAARSCRLSSRDGNQDASDVLRDEEHTLGSQLATLRELHPEALLSPTAASPIDPEIWATPRDAAPTDPEVGTDNPTPGRSGGNEVALAAAASPRRAHLGGVSLLLGLGHSPTGMSRNTNPEGRAEAGGLAGGGGSRGQEVPGPVFCAASKVILACVIRTAARSPGSEPGGSGSQSRPTWERQLAAMAEWLLQGSCESGRLSAAASLLGDLLQMERELSQLFANTSDWGRNGEKGLGVAHRVQAALLAVWLGVVQGCRGPAQVAGGGVAEAAVHTVLLFPLAVLLQPCRAPEPHVDLETLCRAWEEAHARLAGPSAESQLASSKLCAAANQLLCYSGVDWRSMSRPLRPLASCMATSFGCTVEQLAALEAAPCIAADERCTGPSVHTGRTIVQGAPSARRGLVPASSASPQHQGEETPHGQDPRGSPKPRGAPGNRRRSPSPMSGPAPKAASGVPGAGLKHELSPSPLPAARTLKRTASAENVAGEEVSRVASKEGADPRDLGKLQQPAGRVSRQMLLGCQPPRTEGSKFNSGLGENNGSAWQRAPDPKGAAALLAPACASSISRKLSGQGGHWRAAPGNGLGTNAPAAVCQAPKPGRAAGHGITQGKRKRTLQALEQSSQTEYVVIPRKKTAPSEPDKAMLTDRQREVLERQRAGLQREGFKFYMSLDPASQGQSQQTALVHGEPPAPPLEPGERQPPDEDLPVADVANRTTVTAELHGSSQVEMQPKEDRASHDALPGCRGDAGHKLSAPPFRGSMDAGDAEAGNPKRLHHTGESLARASDPACAAGAALKEHDEASAAEGLIALIAAKPLEPAIDRAQQEARGSCKAKPGVSPHESQAGCRNGDLGMPNESPGCAEKAERCGASGSRHPHAHAAQPAVCEFAPECPTHSGAARQGKEEQCAKPVGSIRADEPGPSDRDVAELEIRATQLTPQEQGSDGIGSAQQLRVRLMKALDRSFSDGVWSGADLKELCLAQAQVASILQMLSREISAKGFS